MIKFNATFIMGLRQLYSFIKKLPSRELESILRAAQTELDRRSLEGADGEELEAELQKLLSEGYN